MQSLTFLIAISIMSLAFGVSPDNIKDARNPTVDGLVVLAPATNDLNTCFPEDGYDDGGFYIQDKNGGGIWVCPASNTLVHAVNYGDTVRVTGSIRNNKIHTLTLKASSIRVIGIANPNQPNKEVVTPMTYEQFENQGMDIEYGTLVSYEGYVSKWWVEDVGAGFGITDCDGNAIKGWWTTQEGVDVFELFGLNPCESNCDDSWQDSYFEMIGFYEVYDPFCETWGGPEFQPRLQNINKIDNPCT